jgi:urease accessory protein
MAAKNHGIILPDATRGSVVNAMTGAAFGAAGQRCMATLFLVAGSKLDKARRQAALDIARDLLQGHALEATAGATSPDAQVVVLRVLTPVVEPAMDLLKLVWRAWRKALWQLEAPNPRIWSA